MSETGEEVQQLIGWFLIIFPGILFLGQIISSVNFALAQRLGLQENPGETDLLLQRAEKYVAYWDLVTMGWLPEWHLLKPKTTYYYLLPVGEKARMRG